MKVDFDVTAAAPTILIIDDTAAQRTVLKNTVEQLGYRAVTAGSGAEGLRLLGEAQPSLVLLDLIMPGLDGYAVAKAIRGRAGFVPIIALTSLNDLDAKRRGQESGTDDFLTKPVDPVALRIRIAAMLRIKSLADALAAANGRLSSLIESLPDGVWLISDGRVVFANGRVASLLGSGSADDVIGRAVLELCVPEERPRMQARIRRLMGEGAGERTEEFRFLRPNGEPVDLEFCGVRTIYNDQPTLLEIVHDMTETKRMRKQLLVRDRISSLGRLAAGVGHEINNPLSFVLGNLEYALEHLEHMLAQGTPHPELAEVVQALREAREGGDRVRRIVRDLNTFSGRDGDKSTAADLHRVLDWTAQIAGNEIRHRAQLIKDYGEVPRVMGSETRLSQVFLNLLMNAAQAIPAGDALNNRICIRTSRVRDQVVVEISDTGQGITPATREQLFEPFFTTKPVGEGVGLGLSICHEIVRQLGGEISVESEPGQGSCFRVTLQASEPLGASPSADPPRPAGQPRQRVLVVDDEPLIGRALRRILPEHDVVTETNGHAALERIKAGDEFDLVLCDLMMPEMFGSTFFERMSTIAPTLAGRTVFITGGAFTAEAQQFVQEVNRPILSKPLQHERLRELLEKRLK